MLYWMPERSRKKRPTDLNKLAASIVNDATEPEPTLDEVRALARLLRPGGTAAFVETMATNPLLRALR